MGLLSGGLLTDVYCIKEDEEDEAEDEEKRKEFVPMTEAEILTRTKEFLLQSNKSESVFLTVFLDEPGKTARNWGPDAANEGLRKVNEFLKDLDEFVATEAGFKAKTNLLIVSTPGYSGVSAANSTIDEDFGSLEVTGKSPILNAKADKNPEIAVNQFSVVKQYSEASKKFKVFTQSTLPKTWRYTLKEQFVLVANPGSAFKRDFDEEVKKRNEESGREAELTNEYGFNGYDNNHKNMRSVIIGKGPKFHGFGGVLNGSNASTVDVFPLLCKLLKLNGGSSRDGNVKRLDQMLMTSPPSSDFKKQVEEVIKYVAKPEHLVVTVAIALSSVVIVISLCCILAIRRRNRRLMLAQQGFRYSKV